MAMKKNKQMQNPAVESKQFPDMSLTFSRNMSAALPQKLSLLISIGTITPAVNITGT